MSRSTRFALGLLVVAALLRVAYLTELAANPFYDYPVIDAAEYYGWASTIAEGRWLWTRPHIHGPIYPYILGVAIALGASFRGLYAINLAAGLATLFLLWKIARFRSGGTVALVALVGGIFYAHFLYFEGLLLATAVVTLLDVAVVYSALELRRRKARAGAWLIPGIVLGISAITRPTILVALPALAFWSWWSAGRTVSKPAAVILGAALLVGPVTLQNIAIGDPVLIQANGGMNFYIANRNGADGLASVRPGVQWKNLERLATEAGATRETDRDSYYYSKGTKEVLAAPGESISRVAKRLLLFCGGWEVDTSQDFQFYRSQSKVLRLLALPAGIILPFALIGIAGAVRRRALEDLPLLVLASYLIAIVVFPYSSRYRIPVFPFLILFFAEATVQFARNARAKKLSAGTLTVLLILILALNTIDPGLPEAGVMRTELHLGKRLYDGGDYHGALAAYDEALAFWPGDADILNNRGLANEALGNNRAARADYEAAVRSAPRHGKARANLAGIFFHEGKQDSALAQMELAVNAEPGNAEFCNNYGVLLMNRGETKKALEVLERGIDLNPGSQDVLYNLGQVCERLGRYEEARDSFLRLAEIAETKQVRLQLGRIAERLGRLPDAVTEYSRALELDPDYAEPRRNIGFVLLQMGQVDDGIRHLDRYLAQHPGDDRTRQIREEAGARRSR